MTEIQLEPGAKIISNPLFRWRIIYPIRNKDGSTNWFNLLTGGSWGNLLMVFLIVCVMLLLIFTYRADVDHLVERLNWVAENPCEWCRIQTAVDAQNAEAFPMANKTAWAEFVVAGGG